jgi:hypothetical protein
MSICDYAGLTPLLTPLCGTDPFVIFERFFSKAGVG